MTESHFENQLSKSQLPENYWLKIAEELYKKSGRIPDPIEIRSISLIKALDLPSGPYSALETNEEYKRQNLEKDRIIAKYLTNHPGIEIEQGIISLDPRDIYPDGLPKELEEVLDPSTKKIFEVEYKHARYIKREFGDTTDDFKTDYPIHYFRLPGGIDLIIRGCAHHAGWHKIHGNFLTEANKNAAVICIEGDVHLPYGESIPDYFSADYFPIAYSDGLILKNAINTGFNGLFTEVDARDESKIRMDTFIVKFPDLPDEFFEEYYNYLVREQPTLKGYIPNPLELKKILKLLSTVEGLESRLESKRAILYKNSKKYCGFPYITERNKTSFIPTFLEFGQLLFTDALAAIKLHLIAKLMSDGHIKKGPIIDYEGAGHLSSKTFFLKNPQYAMIVVLRTINELMAGRIKIKGNIPEIYEVFRNPNWPEIAKEIVKLIFYKYNPKQGKLQKIEPDILTIYGIDPSKIVPSDEEIQRKFYGQLYFDFLDDK